MKTEDIFILSGSRTPMGSYGGSLSSLTAIELGIRASKNSIEKANIPIEEIEAIVFGNVLSAGLGQAPARQVSMGTGLAVSACATTINKVCASGMKAIGVLMNDLRMGDFQLGLAGGMESMSGVPHYIPQARFGLGYGDRSLIDGLSKDGLTDAYHFKPMGASGDLTASKYSISREVQDDFAENSFRKSTNAWEKGHFKSEIAPVEVAQKKGDPVVIYEDDAYKKVNYEKMRQLKPVFSVGGTVTAANASPMSDGASALILGSSAYVKDHQLNPKFRIIAYAEAENEPDAFTTTPILATEKVLKKSGLTLKDIDCFEINEAFAVVPIVYIQQLKIDPNLINCFGGAISLGHPLGSSGARIVITLMNILDHLKKRYGLAAICNGGGGASALVIERL